MNYEISTDINRIDLPLVHEFLSSSYWAKDRPLEVVEKSIRNSLCFGVYHNDRQVAFARLITDRAVFAFLADVFVVPDLRGCGISTLLIKEVLKHPHIVNLSITMLGTRDAHGLYEKFGFKRLNDPERIMALFSHEIGGDAP